MDMPSVLDGAVLLDRFSPRIRTSAYAPDAGALLFGQVWKYVVENWHEGQKRGDEQCETASYEYRRHAVIVLRRNVVDVKSRLNS